MPLLLLAVLALVVINYLAFSSQTLEWPLVPTDDVQFSTLSIYCCYRVPGRC